MLQSAELFHRDRPEILPRCRRDGVCVSGQAMQMSDLLSCVSEQPLHLCYAGALIGNFAASDSPDFQVRSCGVPQGLLPLHGLCATLSLMLPLRRMTLDEHEGLITKERHASCWIPLRTQSSYESPTNAIYNLLPSGLPVAQVPASPLSLATLTMMMQS